MQLVRPARRKSDTCWAATVWRWLCWTNPLSWVAVREPACWCTPARPWIKAGQLLRGKWAIRRRHTGDDGGQFKVYFAHLRSPWERATKENTNGLLRQYLPKSSQLSVFSQAELDHIAFKLNVRPRSALGRKCPAELFLPEGSFDFQACWASALAKPVALGA